MKKHLIVLLTCFIYLQTVLAQTSSTTVKIPVSNADLGTFPYFKNFANYRPRNSSDSITLSTNQAYFFDGKKFFSIEGMVSSQVLSTVDNKINKLTEFQIIKEFDKIVQTLGGIKIYTGKLPADLLKPLTGIDDLVPFYLKYQLVSSAHYGVVEYVVKTPEKEVWIQLQPYSIASEFYSVLVVDKKIEMLSTNINKENSLLKQLEKQGSASIQINFVPDSAIIETVSAHEVLGILGVYQAHPNWKLNINVHTAAVGSTEYAANLTKIRAAAIAEKLQALGVSPEKMNCKGMGDTKPIQPNTTEKARLANNRVEISKS
jgi:OmpA-OmpF porin, OOP family